MKRKSLREHIAELSHLPADECWILPHRQASRRGGYIQSGDRGRRRLAHHVAYEMFVGPVPPNHDLHHECHHGGCVNPKHLQPLPRGPHSRLHHSERTHCKRGHEYTRATTYYQTNIKPNGKRVRVRNCAICHSERGVKSRVKVGVQPLGVRRRSKYNPAADRCPHPQTPDNTYTRASGREECRICRSEKFRAWAESHRKQPFLG